ncbi:MAG: hypothetical protein QXD03_02100 [Candidatus Anstonellales archaeon]
MEIFYSHSFPYNHLLIVSLAYDSSKNHSKYFAFVSIIPGEGPVENRTYNFNNKISMKFDIRELLSLSIALRSAAMNSSANILPYTKFSKIKDRSKILTVFKTRDSDNNQRDSDVIVISVASGNTKYGIKLSIPDAYSIGYIIENMAKFCVEKDIIDFKTSTIQSKPQIEEEFQF